MLICWLPDVPDVVSDPLEVVGSKGTNLARLLRMGLPVPSGFVVTTVAYRAFLSATGLAELAGAALTTQATNTDLDLLRTRILEAPFPTDLSAAILAAYEQLGAPAVAVRSSGTAEDLVAASFAGQHDTMLNVVGTEPLLAAVRACWASLWSPRAVAYRRERGWTSDSSQDAQHAEYAPIAQGGQNEQGARKVDGHELALAVVIQRMVPADAAGVAFTANPITGDRTETTISAIRGLGERLVSGQAVADEWIVRDHGQGATAQVICRRAPERALNAAQAQAVAGLAHQIAEHFGTPQDVEWAISNGEIFVLQARPMTAVPEPVIWKAPLPGGWMRNFRLGEWLPEPVTPLFESWLLTRIEEGFVRAVQRDVGIYFRPPYHVIVNGWYFTTPAGTGLPFPSSIVAALLRHPQRVLAVPLSLRWPQFTDRVLVAPLAARWHDEVLPRYQWLVASWQKRVAAASPSELVELVEEIADVAGEYFWLFSVVGGHAWKAEQALARFYHQHLVTQIQRSHQELLLGLPTPFSALPAYAVQSLDWYRPTFGEAQTQADETRGEVEAARATPDVSHMRHQRLEATRQAAEAACKSALRGQPKLFYRFNALLALAQHSAVVREEQAGWFTLGWPVLRQAVKRLGVELRQRDIIEQAKDTFWLTQLELDAGLNASLRSRADAHDAQPELSAAVTARRQEWQQQRRFSPPLVLGKPLGASVLAGAVEAMRLPIPGIHSAASTADAIGLGDGMNMAKTVPGAEMYVLRGMPASPGRASGPVRMVSGPEDFVCF